MKDLQLKPVSDDNAKNVESKLKSDKLATRSVCCGFRGPYWGDGIEDTSADTVEHTRAKHPIGILSGRLKGSSKNAPDASETNRGNATITITHPAA